MELLSQVAAIVDAPPGAARGVGGQPPGLDYQATEAVEAALARIGRTEDVDFSPSGKRLALAGFRNDYLLILEMEAEGRSVALTECLEVASPAFKSPHGLCWLDERTLIVGNRYGEISVFELPEDRRDGRVALDPIRTLGADPAELIDAPGSVLATPAGLGLVELIVCNNYGHYVTRHLLDARDCYAPIASTIIAAEGLEVPDGAARSRSGRWLAISNHGGHNVLVFRAEECLGTASQPRAVLRGVGYPHGLAFTPDERSLLVADAGGRFIHLFVSADGEWRGEYGPKASIEVFDEALFRRGNLAPGDRGPKGVALTPDGRLMAVTCEKQTLAFFDLHGVTPQSGESAAAPEAAGEAERARAALLGHLAAARVKVDEAARTMREAADWKVEIMSNSRSWRFTAPLRRLRAAMRRS